jgi:hypothetical protein
LTENANEKIYDKIDSIFIEENTAIINIKFTLTGVDGTQVIVSWETI